MASPTHDRSVGRDGRAPAAERLEQLGHDCRIDQRPAVLDANHGLAALGGSRDRDSTAGSVVADRVLRPSCPPCARAGFRSPVTVRDAQVQIERHAGKRCRMRPASDHIADELGRSPPGCRRAGCSRLRASASRPSTRRSLRSTASRMEPASRRSRSVASSLAECDVRFGADDGERRPQLVEASAENRRCAAKAASNRASMASMVSASS